MAKSVAKPVSSAKPLHPPIIAVVGDDVYLQLQAVREAISSLPADAQRIDLDGETAKLADTLDELRSFSMFGGYKLVIIRSADDFVSRFREQLEDYAARPSDSGTMLLRLASLPKNQRIYKAIEKVGQIITCEPPKLGDIPGWIIRRAASAHQLKVTSEAANVLSDLIGADLGRLDNELAKLSLQVEDGVLKPTDISVSVVFQREQQMWDMTDALSLGKPAEAVKRWRQLLASDPSSEFRAVTWLGLWVEKASKALAMKKQGMNGFVIAKELKIWPAANADKLLLTVDKLGEHRLRVAVEKLLDVDRKNKSGLGEPAANVEQFLQTMAL